MTWTDLPKGAPCIFLAPKGTGGDVLVYITTKELDIAVNALSTIKQEEN